MSRTSTLPVGVASVGGLLPEETLRRLSTGNSLPGTTPAAYHLGKDETVVDAAERAWTYLRGRYASFKDQLAKLSEDDPAIGVTREYWLGRLFQELGFGRLPHTPAGGLTSDDGEKQFAISHQWQHVPIHQLGWGVALDKRTKGVPGAADSAPQSLVQEYLNRSDAALWGIVTNGRLLRALRDSSALAGSAYVEFDLEAIFEGEAFDAFVLLYRVAHVSRFETQGEDAGPASCWLEKWRQEAIDSGLRVLDQLRLSVKAAIEALGTGFIQHPDNDVLRKALADRDNTEVTPETLHRALLRVVYRLLFLFVIEDRGVLFALDTPVAAQDRYMAFFATARLRRLAARRHGGPHSDEWQALSLVLDGLGRKDGLPELGVPALGGIFKPTDADRPLFGCALANEHLFTAVRSLSRVRDLKARRIRPVDFRHLGAEELGSVYEWLLEYVPKHDAAQRTFALLELSGNDRKKTGSYYTPTSLVDCLLDTTLDPVIDDAVKSARTKEEQEKALLALTICDPACGSGHFLVAAARRIAKRLASVRTGDPEPGIEDVRHALREVVSQCIYGVDLNPMAIELAKVSLWLETVEPGKPLGFLDAHLKVGNALLGTTPKLLAGGLPDDAFKPIEGDDKKWAAALKKRNKAEREAWEKRASQLQGKLFDDFGLRSGNADLAEAATGITQRGDGTWADIDAQEKGFQALQESAAYVDKKRVADAWCAAFVWWKVEDKGYVGTQRRAPAITMDNLLDVKRGAIAPEIGAELEKLTEQYCFFHWHLEFPEVFGVPEEEEASGVDERTGWTGGFSCVLGNPPWERIKLQEQEFFATRDEEIATAPNKAARARLIEALRENEPKLYAEFGSAKRQAEAESHFLRMSGRYPLTGRGDINTYAVFAEADRNMLGSHGRLGVIVPTGIATDATTQYFFRDVAQSDSLASLYDFENAAPLFSSVHRSFKFALLTLTGREARESKADFAFFLHNPAELGVPLKRFSLSPEEIALINPNTGTCPVFRSRRDAEITLGIYRRLPVLVREGDPDGNPWGISFMTMFHMANDARLFRTREQLEADGWRLQGNIFVRGDHRYLPLYEAKMLHHYDHRWATYEQDDSIRDVTSTEKRDPNFVVMPRYWAPEHDIPTGGLDKQCRPIIDAGIASRLTAKEWHHGWLLGWRDVCRATDERTAIPAFIPRVAVGHKFLLALSNQPMIRLAALIAMQSSMAFDYVSRQKIGGTSMSLFIWMQLPVLTFDILDSRASFIASRILELVYTDRGMAPFARDLGDTGTPFLWDEERRRLLRAELDSAFFHLYGIDRDGVDYIMETFPIVKKKDVAAFGAYKTKELILDVYDAMDQAIRTGESYQTILNPPPGQGARHPARI
ncbi:DNA methyltransferase [Actinoallomurus sp. NPDC052308]|uniref:Eco57I restriction-modification methylase domain-containing protein n=1 Tax=Actinoallomurus sp. NPDC052308 TaxID=3155530 RepID=UPI00341934DD